MTIGRSVLEWTFHCAAPARTNILPVSKYILTVITQVKRGTRWLRVAKDGISKTVMLYTSIRFGVFKKLHITGASANTYHSGKVIFHYQNIYLPGCTYLAANC